MMVKIFLMKNLMMNIDDYLRIVRQSARPNTPDPVTEEGAKVVLFIDEFERYSAALVAASKDAA